MQFCDRMFSIRGEAKLYWLLIVRLFIHVSVLTFAIQLSRGVEILIIASSSTYFFMYVLSQDIDFHRHMLRFFSVFIELKLAVLVRFLFIMVALLTITVHCFLFIMVALLTITVHRFLFIMVTLLTITVHCFFLNNLISSDAL